MLSFYLKQFPLLNNFQRKIVIRLSIVFFKNILLKYNIFPKDQHYASSEKRMFALHRLQVLILKSLNVIFLKQPFLFRKICELFMNWLIKKKERIGCCHFVSIHNSLKTLLYVCAFFLYSFKIAAKFSSHDDHYLSHHEISGDTSI